MGTSTMHKAHPDTPFSGSWYHEVNSQWPGQALSIKTKKVLFDKKSKYQHIEVFETETFGKIFCLDGVIQVTDRDQFAYAEMMAHLPLMAHPKPEKVLIIGGGDAAILTEVLKHKTVTSVVLCDIDEMVYQVAREFFPHYAKALDDKRVTIKAVDGAKLLEESKAEFDVVIVDSSDPVGPAATLFQEKFYKSLRASLREGGLTCAQGECMWIHLDLMKSMRSWSKKLYSHVDYAFTTIPSYPSGQIGCFMCSLGPDPKKVERTVEEALGAEASAGLRYYSADIHKAAFVLPAFAKKALDSA